MSLTSSNLYSLLNLNLNYVFALPPDNIVLCNMKLDGDDRNDTRSAGDSFFAALNLGHVRLPLRLGSGDHFLSKLKTYLRCSLLCSSTVLIQGISSTYSFNR